VETLDTIIAFYGFLKGFAPKTSTNIGVVEWGVAVDIGLYLPCLRLDARFG